MILSLFLLRAVGREEMKKRRRGCLSVLCRPYAMSLVREAEESGPAQSPQLKRRDAKAGNK